MDVRLRFRVDACRVRGVGVMSRAMREALPEVRARHRDTWLAPLAGGSPDPEWTLSVRDKDDWGDVAADVAVLAAAACDRQWVRVTDEIDKYKAARQLEHKAKAMAA